MNAEPLIVEIHQHQYEVVGPADLGGDLLKCSYMYADGWPCGSIVNSQVSSWFMAGQRAYPVAGLKRGA